MLPDGAIFCGECGRAVTAAASRRPVAPTPVEQAPPPPLQQPDAHGRRSDPASDAWLPESTLDPATRAWLTGADRRGTEPPAPVPVQRPDDFAPRQAPSHVHGAGSGLGDWSGAPGQSDPEPALDPDAYPSEPLDADDPERTRIAPAPGRPATPAAPVRDAAMPGREQTAQQPVAPPHTAESALPVWAPPAATAPPAAPAGPSWWVGRGTPAAETPSEPVVPPVPGAPADPATEQGAAAPASDPQDGQDAQGAQDAQPGSEPERDEVIVAASETSAADDQPAVVSPPQPGDTAVVEPLIDRRPPRPAPLVTPGMHETTICHVCGNRLEPDDIFCGECGAVRPAVTAAFTGPVMPLPMTRPDWAAEGSDETQGSDGTEGSDGANGSDGTATSGTADDADEPAGGSSDPTGSDESDESGSDENSADELAAHDEQGDEPHDEVPVDDEPVRAGVEQSGSGRRARRAHAAPVSEPEASALPRTSIPPVPGSVTVPSSAPSATAPGAPLAAPLPPIPGATGPALPLPPASPSESNAGAETPDDPDDDVDETRIVAKTPTRAPFVLHFSTGERLGVHGTGLLGRLPRPQPGERYDDLLTVHDPGKSVSKTHLELGRDGDDLWVSDRFSGNGTVVRHIDGSIRRCEPGRRYRVERGARVDIGEQFFLVQ
ncbi:FHA domain-containing protein [Curtobacterium flaccumfaciens pv. flaccumfaciens]|nr:FHA domain-containing protein [Curtobacterium flaccumfaciens]MBT1585838.1 FHA domain-containing protein [Curtobacterium flaccumfaciens pv. flaccumfaciens]MCS5494066.1 FHA domain-containing protein [Curtobacterium flaccumfaciens pv. flaccumfaciens]MCX2796738.1 FHA domain-containing protein [Curtobacterium flaccumfaciens pv. flaccumfaciens]